MFELKIVNSCPVSRGTRGIVVMDRGVVGEIAGAMESQKGIEWAILLLGQREQDGRLIRVTGLSVPRQSRSAGDVQLPEMKLGEDVVGILHSHHSIPEGAFFSQTDHTQLNPRFGLSIVVAETDGLHENKNRAGRQASVFGWDYLAEARTTLPCGKMGVIEMDVTTDDLTSREVEWESDGVDRSGCEDERDIGVGGFSVQAICGLVGVTFKKKAFGLGTGVIEQGLRENTIDRAGGVVREVVPGYHALSESRWAGWTDEDWERWQKGYDKFQDERVGKRSRREFLWDEGDLVEMVDNQSTEPGDDEEGYWLFDMLYEEWMDDETVIEREYDSWIVWLYQWSRRQMELLMKGETGYEGD